MIYVHNYNIVIYSPHLKFTIEKKGQSLYNRYHDIRIVKGSRPMFHMLKKYIILENYSEMFTVILYYI